MTSPEPAVALRGVHHTYGRGTAAVRALDGVDLDLAAGTFTAIMGRSGSGKSTLLQCAAGLDRPTAGTVRLAGTDLAGLSETALTKLRRTRVGFVFSPGRWRGPGRRGGAGRGRRRRSRPDRPPAGRAGR